MADKYWSKGLRVLAVNVRPSETASVVSGFAREQGLKHILLLDGQEVAMKYGVKGVPTTFFIDRDGKIVDSEVGFNPASLEASALKVLPK